MTYINTMDPGLLYVFCVQCSFYVCSQMALTAVCYTDRLLILVFQDKKIIFADKLDHNKTKQN